jgi:hypothetical protein
MANEVAVTAAEVGLVDPLKAVVKSYIAGVVITKGQAVYIIAASGKLGLCTAAAANQAAQFRGIALNGGGIGQAIDVLEDGEVYGFTLAGNYDALISVHDTAGVLSITTGTVHVHIGRVAPMTNAALTKVLRIFTPREADWA